MRSLKSLRLLGPVFIAQVLILGLLIAFISAGTGQATTSGELHVCPSCNYNSIQEAVDDADPGDTIKVAAGTYTDVHVYLHWGSPITQVVFIDKSITIEGGYTTTNWLTPDPNINPTVLDANGEGRVYWVYDDTDTVIDVTLSGLTITGGDNANGGHDGPGGGVYARKTNLEIKDCQFVSNTATMDGGGLYLYQGQANVVDSVFLQNAAGLGGGGICLFSSPITMDNSQIMSNTAQNQGGGMYVSDASSTVEAANNLFQNNYAKFGGGALFMAYAGGVLTNNDFINNSNYLSFINVDGGALRADYPPSLEINGGSFTGNESGGRGGAVNVVHSDAVTVTGVLMKNNTAGNEGGAVFFSYVTGLMQNNAVVDNQVGNNGSGLFLSSSDVDMHQTTIARNTGGDGTGLYVAHNVSQERFSIVNLYNTIVAGQAQGAFADIGDLINLNTTLWNENTSKYSGPVNNTNNQDGDPLFAPDGYHIMWGSAAIEKGNPNYTPQVVDDIDSDPRPMWSSYEIGADEYPFKAAKYLSTFDELHPGDPVNFTLVINNYSPFTYTLSVTDVVPSCLIANDPMTWNAIIKPNSNWFSGVIHFTVAPGTDGTCTNSMAFTTLEGPRGSTSKDIEVIGVISSSVTQGEGGSLVIEDEGQPVIEIQAPAGAVTETTELVYKAIDDPATTPAGMLFAGRAFDLSAYRDETFLANFSFESGITVTLHYADDDIAGLDEDTLMLYTWTGSDWSTDGIIRVAADPDKNTVTFWLVHLTEFAQFGQSPGSDYRIYLPLVLRS